MRRRLKPGAVTRARELRTRVTDTERKLWYRLRVVKALGYHFRRQAPFRAYTLDFVEHAHRLIIELDGSQHGFAANLAHDAKRDSFLRGQGYRVLRFGNVDVLKDMDTIVESILHALENQKSSSRTRVTPTPTSPSWGGRRAEQSEGEPGGGNPAVAQIPPPDPPSRLRRSGGSTSPQGGGGLWLRSHRKRGTA